MGPELAERRRAPGSSFKPNVWVLPQGRVTRGGSTWVALLLPASTGALVKNAHVGSSLALPSLGVSDGFIRALAVPMRLHSPHPQLIFFCMVFV